MKNVLVVSERDFERSPAMCCVVEMEDVLVRAFGGQLLSPNAPLPKGDLSTSIAFFSAIRASRLGLHRKCLNDLRARGATVVCYIFDAWTVPDFFNDRARRMKSALSSQFSLAGVCDHLAIPFQEAIDRFSPNDRKIVLHLPLGVDSSLVNGMHAERPVTALAYGRQPESLIAELSVALNGPDSDGLLYHTDHTEIRSILDFHAHRRQFWKIAQNSAIALAYDPWSTHQSRFPFSIVGQRWFECLAAGCAVVGRRPVTPEADTLIGWQDATLEAPDDPKEAVDFILDLSRDKARLQEIRERNVEHIRSQHDWTHRIEQLFRMI